MSKNFVNKTYIEGYVYEHSLESKVSGDTSKNPGTEYITGILNVATDNACINIVPVHFTYVTATTAKGQPNTTYNILKNIIDGVVKTVMAEGKEKAGKVRIDSALGLNEFYTDRNGTEELVSAKRNEGGFIHLVDVLNEDEQARNTFNCDMLITGARRIEANEEKELPEKVILKGAIFDYRKALLPVEFSVTDEVAMDYFEGLEASSKNPVFTRVQGNQISETIVKKIKEESAFGNAKIREVTSSRKDFVVNWASPNPYELDDPSTLTIAELNEAIAAREVYLATIKKRQEDYKASKQSAFVAPAATVSKGGFDF